MVNKKVCFIYDTFKDMKDDQELFTNMIVMTLGYNTINDKKGSIYKIITKDEAYSNNIKGEPLSKSSKLFAMSIDNTDDTEIVDSKNYDNDIDKINKSLKDIENSVSKINQHCSLIDDRYDKLLSSIEDKNADTLNATSVCNSLYIDDRIKIVQLNNGSHYIINENNTLTKINVTINISKQNSWIVPTIMSVCDYKLDVVKVGTSSDIKYSDNSLIFNIDFSKIKKCIIEY